MILIFCCVLKDYIFVTYKTVLFQMWHVAAGHLSVGFVFCLNCDI